MTFRCVTKAKVSVEINKSEAEQTNISIKEEIRIFFLPLISTMCPEINAVSIEGIASASPIRPSEKGSFVSW